MNLRKSRGLVIIRTNWENFGHWKITSSIKSLGCALLSTLLPLNSMQIAIVIVSVLSNPNFVLISEEPMPEQNTTYRWMMGNLFLPLLCPWIFSIESKKWADRTKRRATKWDCLVERQMLAKLDGEEVSFTGDLCHMRCNDSFGFTE